ncbi:MHP [Streptococcus pneumoniae]|nr:MHP [Streptococcus pneumoniae]CAG6328782.1 MHP [Streptococcus pneumoniae]
MTAGQTKLATMVNPEVMADMVSAKLPKLIREQLYFNVQP